MLALLSLAAAFLLASGSDFSCPKTPIRLNGSAQVFENSLIPPGTSCNFTFLIDDNDYADVFVWGRNFVKDASLLLIGDFDTIDLSYDNDYVEAAFPPKKITISVNSGTQTEVLFEFSVINKPVIFSPSPTILTVKPNEPAIITNIANSANDWKITSTDSQFVLRANAFVPNLVYQPASRLNMLLYEDNGNGKIPLGSLNSLMNHKTFTQNVTIYTAPVLGNQFFFTTLIANHPTNLADCNSYYTLWPNFNAEYLPISLRADDGTTCVTILNEFYQLGNGLPSTLNENVPYLNKGCCDEATTEVTVITGAPIVAAKRNVLGTIGLNSSSISFPQFFPGHARTIMLTKGSITLATSVKAQTQDSLAYEGRKGLIISSNYDFVDTMQGASFGLQSNQTFVFTLNVVNTDNPSNSTVEISGDNHLATRIYLNNPSNVTVTYKLTAKKITVTIIPSGAPNKGTLLKYAVTADPNQTTTQPPLETTTRAVSTASGFLAMILPILLF